MLKVLVLFGLFLISIPLAHLINLENLPHSSEFLQIAMLVITTAGFFILLIILFLELILKKKALAIGVSILSASTTIAAVHLIKNLLKVPRPEVISLDIPLAYASGYSFPSLHTALAFSFLPVMEKYLPKKYVYLWLFIASLIAFSRLYLGVHSIVDVTGGIFIAYFIGTFAVFLEQRFRLIENFFHHIHNKFELRRQLMHLCTGLSIVILYDIGLLSLEILIIVLLAGGLFSIISRRHRIPVLAGILQYFERDYPKCRFPGQGAFFLVLGSTLAIYFFEKNIALAAISIMAIGDSVTHVIGLYFGKIKSPLNPEKKIEGLIAAICTATLGASFFVPFFPAFLAAAGAMIVESLNLCFFKYRIDDNLIIPLVAGYILTSIT